MNDEQMKTVVDAILDKGLTIEEMIDVCLENNADAEYRKTQFRADWLCDKSQSEKFFGGAERRV